MATCVILFFTKHSADHVAHHSWPATDDQQHHQAVSGGQRQLQRSHQRFTLLGTSFSPCVNDHVHLHDSSAIFEAALTLRVLIRVYRLSRQRCPGETDTFFFLRVVACNPFLSPPRSSFALSPIRVIPSSTIFTPFLHRKHDSVSFLLCLAGSLTSCQTCCAPKTHLSDQ